MGKYIIKPIKNVDTGYNIGSEEGMNNFALEGLREGRTSRGDI